MAIVLREQENVHVLVELYAPDIRIRGNPVAKAAGSIQVELNELEYRDGEFYRFIPIGAVGETVGQFAAREFTVDGKVITGLDVVKVVEMYTGILHAENQAPPAPEPEESGDEPEVVDP